jgi:hypothetical protein
MWVGWGSPPATTIVDKRTGAVCFGRAGVAG